LSQITQTNERDVPQPQVTGPQLRPDLDLMSIILEAPAPNPRSTKDDSVLLAVPPLNGAGGLWWA
jgi:hypothetical protein